MNLADLDPRVKLLMMAAVSTVSLISQQPLQLAAVLLLILLCLIIGGVGPERIWKQARTMVKLIALLFVIQCVFRRDGNSVLAIEGFTLVTDVGWNTALLVSLRLFIIIFSALLVMTGQIRDYLLALRWCRLPYEIVYMVLAALRFIPLLREEAQDVNAAFRMRGCDIAAASWRQKARLYITMLVPITAGALHRAERTSLAMEARAFRARPGRSQWRSLRFTGQDALYMIIFLLLLAGLVIFL